MIRFYPLLPVWLIVVVGAVALMLVWFVAMNGMDLSNRKRYTLVGLRLASVVTVIIMLLCPGLVVRELNRQRSNVVVMLDASGSMKTADMPEGKTRFEDAQKFSKYLERQSFSGCKKHFYMFNSKAAPFESGDLEMFSPHSGTDLKRAFDTVNKDIGFSRIAAVLLLSDGIDHSGFTGSSAGIPIFAAKFGSELTRVPDLRIDSFKYPEKLRCDEEMELEVPVALTGYKQAENVELSFYVDGAQIEKKKIQLKPDSVQNIKFKHAFSTPGIHMIKLELNHLENEAGYLNNQRELAIEVQEGKSEIALYFPKLTNSFRPLVRMLQSGGKKFTAVYRFGKGACKVLGIDTNSALENGLPRSASALKSIDLFVLGSYSGNRLSNKEKAIFEQYVSNGGNLILLGGQDCFEQEPVSSPMNSLLPVKASKSIYKSGSFKIAASDNGNDFSKRIIEMCKTVVPLRGINLVDGVKEGAEVLLWAENGSRYPLVVSIPYGRGRAIAVLTDSLHLWGSGEQRRHNFRSFWEQLISYAGASRDESLKVTVNSSQLLPDEKLKVTAIPDLPEDQQKVSPVKIEAGIYPLNDRRATAVINLERQGRLYSADFQPLKAGRYMLQVTCRRKGQVLARRYRLIQVGKNTREASDLKSTMANFLKFCPAGRVYTPEDRQAMMDDVLRTIQKNDIEREWFPVFETPFFFCVLLVLLAAEWYLRRRFNLF
jgi:hypothetical protein